MGKLANQCREQLATAVDTFLAESDASAYSEAAAAAYAENEVFGEKHARAAASNARYSQRENADAAANGAVRAFETWCAEAVGLWREVLGEYGQTESDALRLALGHVAGGANPYEVYKEYVLSTPKNCTAWNRLHDSAQDNGTGRIASLVFADLGIGKHPPEPLAKIEAVESAMRDARRKIRRGAEKKGRYTFTSEIVGSGDIEAIASSLELAETIQGIGK